MNIYLLKRKNGSIYDCVWNFVIRAETPVAARNIAVKNHGDEGMRRWVNREDSSCQCIASDCKGKSGVVLRDFHPG